jgi:hypothetical protein
VEVKIYRNKDMEAIYAIIPPGHSHTRFVLKARDTVIVLQEATVAALLRAYAMTTLHPSNRATAMFFKRLPPSLRKRGFAEYQAVDEVVGDKAVERVRSDLEGLGLTYTDLSKA